MRGLTASANSVLVIDVGGTRVEVAATRNREERKIPSGSNMTAREKGRDVKRVSRDWEHGLVSSGYPGPVIRGRPLHEPHNLGGWGGFNFGKTSGCPLEVFNDAAVQALGNYEGGQMLFGGLGAGLGSAMIIDGIHEPLGLAHLLYKDGKTYEDYIVVRGLKRFGKSMRLPHSTDVVELLKDALEAECVVLGGGNSKIVEKLPPDTRWGNNRKTFLGDFRLAEKKNQSSTC